MLLERGPSAGIQHIRLQEVLRHTGLTTGAAYRIWSDQTDYQRELAVAMVKLRFTAPAQAAEAAVAELLTTGGGMDDVIRTAAQSHVLQATRTDPLTKDSRAFLIALSLRAAADTWPELLEAAQSRHAESVDEFARFYGEIMRVYGYRMRTPYTLVDFTEAMAALGEGFSLRAVEGLVHPEIDIADGDEGPTGRWTLFGIAIRGLIHEFMVREDDDALPGSADPDRA
jgi:hypothetical protein